MQISIFRQWGYRFFISTDLESNSCAVFAVKTKWVWDTEIPPTYLGFFCYGNFFKAPNFKEMDYGLVKGFQRMINLIDESGGVVELNKVQKIIAKI